MLQDETADATASTFELANRDHLPAIQALCTRAWGTAPSLAYLEWKLFDGPFDPIPPAVAMEGEQCIALHAAIATPLVIDDTYVMGAQAVDITIRPTPDADQLAARLANICHAEAARRGVRLLYSLPDKASQPLFLKTLGWTPGEALTRWVRTLGAPRGLPDFIGVPVGRLMRWQAMRNRPGRAVQVFPVTEATRFAIPDFTPPPAWGAVEKSSAWLGWRYAREPGGAYEQLVLGNPDAPDALIVFDEIERPDGPATIRIDEWLATSAAHRLEVVQALIVLGYQRRCGAILLDTNDPQAGILLRGALFFPHESMPLAFREIDPPANREPLKIGELALVVLGGDRD